VQGDVWEKESEETFFWREDLVFILFESRGALKFRDKDAICDDRMRYISKLSGRCKVSQL
jgi:hypothetical protein